MKQLSPKERVISAMNIEEPDRAPFTCYYAASVGERLSQMLNVDGSLELQLKFGVDLLENSPSREEVIPLAKIREKGKYVDKFGIHFTMSEAFFRGGEDAFLYPPMIDEHPIKDIEAIEEYIFPEPGPYPFDESQEFLDEYGDEYGIYVASFLGIFERAWFLRGFSNLLSDLYRHPRLAEKLLDKVLDFKIKEVDSMIRNMDMDLVDFFMLGDDYGTQINTIMSPAVWRRFIKPRLSKLVKRVRMKALPVALHSCGNISSLIPDLFEIGVSILNPVQPRSMDLKCLKERFGNKMCFFGSIDTQDTLPNGSARDVEKEVKLRMREVGFNGGLILAPSQAILPEVPIRNIFSFINACKKYAFYPQQSVVED